MISKISTTVPKKKKAGGDEGGGRNGGEAFRPRKKEIWGHINERTAERGKASATGGGAGKGRRVPAA